MHIFVWNGSLSAQSFNAHWVPQQGRPTLTWSKRSGTDLLYTEIIFFTYIMHFPITSQRQIEIQVAAEPCTSWQ